MEVERSLIFFFFFKEAIAAQEVWDDDGLAQGVCKTGGEKQLDSGCIFTCKMGLFNSQSWERESSGKWHLLSSIVWCNQEARVSAERIPYRGLKKIVKVWETAKETEGAEQKLF